MTEWGNALFLFKPEQDNSESHILEYELRLLVFNVQITTNN